MSWKEVPVSTFLKARKERFKPSDVVIKGLKRIEKIDFSGNIFLSEKPSNTDMIMIKKGDFVISGINVEKGAMAIYQGNEDITATIHYSSYVYDEEKIDLYFLKNYLKSPEFIDAIKEQVPGGIKTEIKSKHILALKIFIPTDLKEQREIVKKLEANNHIIDKQDNELTHQLDLIKQLRQAFLREAMQGKLTAKWRNENPDVEPARLLLKKIKAEKEKLIKEGKLKNQKPLQPIKEDDFPFEIPESWEWCRLGEISYNISTGPFGTMLHKSDYTKDGIPLVNPMNIVGERIIPSEKMLVSQETIIRLKSYVLNEGDVVIGRRGEMGRCAIVTKNEVGWLCGTGSFFLQLSPKIFRGFFIKFMRAENTRSLLRGNSVGSTMDNLNHRILYRLTVPLPPLPEQQQIVAKLDELIQYCDNLEESIKTSQQQNEMLLQQVLREALDPKT